MHEIQTILERIKFDELMSYCLYDTNANAKGLAELEQELAASYTHFMSKLIDLMPDIAPDNDALNTANAEFAAVHEEFYFMAGALTGFQLYKNMDQGF